MSKDLFTITAAAIRATTAATKLFVTTTLSKEVAQAAASIAVSVCEAFVESDLPAAIVEMREVFEEQLDENLESFTEQVGGAIAPKGLSIAKAMEIWMAIWSCPDEPAAAPSEQPPVKKPKNGHKTRMPSFSFASAFMKKTRGWQPVK